jgi:hypothetical protein
MQNSRKIGKHRTRNPPKKKNPAKKKHNEFNEFHGGQASRSRGSKKTKWVIKKTRWWVKKTNSGDRKKRLRTIQKTRLGG